MVETRPDRHGLVNWSSGSDSGSRLDFNEITAKLNAQAAYDDGDTLTALPVTNLVDARYVLVATGGYRTIYRRSDTSSWDAIGGNTMPRAFNYRALEGQARTATALTFSHPDFVSGGTVGYDGSAALSGTVRIYDSEDVARGALMVGTAAAIGLTTLGRVHVRTRATGERGIVVRPYSPVDPDPGSGNLFTAQAAGGSDVVTIDALGRFRNVAASAFGGAALTSAAVTIAPSDADDGQITGVLLYGQTTDPADEKSIIQVWRDSADTVPLVNVARDNIGIGRLPWVSPRTSGQLQFAANGFRFRASGDAANASWWEWRTSDPTSPVTEANTALDTVQMTASHAGFGFRMPTYISNRNRLELTTLNLLRVTDFNAGFMELGRLIPDGMGGETAQVASFWASDGRLRTGAWFLAGGVNTTRDARQTLTHVSTKRFTTVGAGPTTGQAVDNGQTFTYTWPLMTLRSSGVADLNVTTAMEIIMIGPGLDAQAYSVETLISVDGGGYSVIGTTENATAATETGSRQSGDIVYMEHRHRAVPTGQTVRFRTRVKMSNDNILDMNIRVMDLRVQEVILMDYAAE